MMSELEELYQEVILDHNRSPRNFGLLESANRRAEGYNPLCGDRVKVFVEVEDGRLRNLTFQGAGCAISTASASLMTECLKGKTLQEAQQLMNTFRDLVTGQDEGQEAREVGKLAVFEGVKKYPVRVKCATLAWHTLRAALNQREDPVTTE